MKKNLCIAMALLLLCSVGCGKKNTESPETPAADNQVGQSVTGGENIEAFDYRNTDLSAYITLGKYEGLSATRQETTVTESYLDDQIDTLLEEYGYYTPITDRAVQEGDTVLADYAGTLDGEAFSGGTASNQTITVREGSGYIDGFCAAFVGQMPGETFSFDVAFPAEYSQNEAMAGKTVTFTCTVHSINSDTWNVPELTDAFVQENFQYNTVAEFRILYRDALQEQLNYQNTRQLYTDLWNQIVEESQILQYPEAEVTRLYTETHDVYAQYAESMGISYEEFLTSYLGTTDEQLRTEAREYVKQDLVMYALQKALAAELTEDEYEKGGAFLAAMYGMSTEYFAAYYGEETIRSTLLWEKLLGMVAERGEISVTDSAPAAA